MRPIFYHTFKRLVPQVFGWGLGLAFYCAVVLSFFHIVSDNANEIQKLIASLPKALTSLVGDLSKFNTPEGYMSIRIFGIFPLLLGVFGLICGSGLIVRDEERGFLDLMMGYPITRAQMFFARLGALIVSIIGILLIVWMGIAIGIWLAALKVSVWQVFFPLASLFAILCCFATLSLMFSMVLASRIAATMTGGLVMIITQMLSNLAKLSDTLKPIALLSPFEYYQGVKAFETFDYASFLVLIVSSMTFVFIAFSYFKKRDIRVAGEGEMNWTKFTLATIITLVIFVYTLISLTRDASQLTPKNCFKTATKSIEEKDWKTLMKCVTLQTKKRWCADALLRGSFLALDVGEKGAIRMWQGADERFDFDFSSTQQKTMGSIIQIQMAIANVDIKVLQKNADIILTYPNKLFLTTQEVERLSSSVKNKDAFIQAVLRALNNLRQFENYASLQISEKKDGVAIGTVITNSEIKIPISFTKMKKKWRVDLPELNFIGEEATLETKASEDDMGEYILHQNITYDKKHQLLLDAYVPKNENNLPAILLVHGGGWRSGDKNQLSKYAHFLASNGFACFAISYRLAPKYKFPAQIDDCRQALSWLQKNASTYNINVNKIGAVGYSAGGHLVSLLATENQDGKNKLKVVIAGGAPSDFSSLNEKVTTFRYLFGDTISNMPQLYKNASPVYHASKQSSPIGFFHGEEDMLVSLDGPLSPVKLYNKLTELDVACHMLRIPTAGHFETIYHEQVFPFILEFLQKYLK